jgi:hypothetical protein
VKGQIVKPWNSADVSLFDGGFYQIIDVDGIYVKFRPVNADGSARDAAVNEFWAAPRARMDVVIVERV